MSSLALAPGHLLKGARWDYRIEASIKGDKTHASTVFKAAVIPRGNTPDIPQWCSIVTFHDKKTPPKTLTKQKLTPYCAAQGRDQNCIARR